jgi:glycerol uptake facilitator protein
MKYQRELIGELMGTFLLVLFGTGAVAVSTLFQAHQGLFQIAAIWGIGVSLAIYATRHLSCAHLNPAVTLAMAVCGRMNKKKVPTYLAGQLIGAFLAGLFIYFLFSDSIIAFEISHGIIRGTAESAASARMFGEYYTLVSHDAIADMLKAMSVEGIGTFLLVFMIFSLTEGCNLGRPHDHLAPLFIGLTVASLICLMAPLTQAGFNPARDLGPRLVSLLFGWGRAALPDALGGFFWVYVFAPVLGALAAGLFFTKVIDPLMKRGGPECGCGNTKASEPIDSYEI